MQKQLASWINDFLGLFYPNLCLACDENLPSGMEVLCVRCRHELPATNFHELEDNPLEEIFWGRVAIERAAALYYFSRGERVQHLIHQLKYQHQAAIGYQLGLLYGSQLADWPAFQTIDAVIPVPLHMRKQHQRGYNQAAEFGKGLAERLDIPLLENILERTTFTSTQTQKSRTERLDNVLPAFARNSKYKPTENQHYLLVDDVVTTGATLEACAMRLLEWPDVKVSIAAIAIAE